MATHLITKEVVITDHVATGAQMREARKRTGVSMRQCADIMRISPPYLSDLEQGRRNWNEELVLKHRAACERASKKR